MYEEENTSRWCPVFPDTNEYEVSGTRRQAGAIGIFENFREEVPAKSSRDAYLTVHNKPGWEYVHVVAIKMKCSQCSGYHITVPTELYLGV